MEEQPKLKYKLSESGSSLRQGEILSNVIQYKINIVGERLEDGVDADPIIHPYTIIITQDCDLDWDYKARFTEKKNESKLLNSIILCEVDTAQNIKDITGMNIKAWEPVKKHNHEKYYFFEKVPKDCDLQNNGIPELTADLKKVFAINVENLYRQIELNFAQRRTILEHPYLEHFSRRYQNFHGRIALPSQYESE